jgi:hypothetical protein
MHSTSSNGGSVMPCWAWHFPVSHGRDLPDLARKIVAERFEGTLGIVPRDPFDRRND